MTSIGVLGYGNFGAFLVNMLKDDFKVYAYDDFIDVPDQFKASISKIAKLDYLVLAIPIKSYPKVLKSIKKHIGDNTVIVDISSVKQEPYKLVKKILPNAQYVSTHPLFGVQTIGSGLANKTVVFCDDVSDKLHADKLKKFCLSKSIKVVSLDAREHDHQMAHTQGITFFIGRALLEMDSLRSLDVKPPSFAFLENVIQLSSNHSWELFHTIQKGNPFSQKARDDLLKSLTALNQKLAEEEKK